MNNEEKRNLDMHYNENRFSLISESFDVRFAACVDEFLNFWMTMPEPKQLGAIWRKPGGFRLSFAPLPYDLSHPVKKHTERDRYTQPSKPKGISK